jgi:hypothetical protein
VGASQSIHFVKSAVATAAGAILPSGGSFLVKNARIARRRGSFCDS